jgi:hypothetical protein
MQNNFKDTGISRTVLSAHQSGAGKLVDAPAAGHIIIVDILASAASIISTSSAGTGTIIAYAPAGSSCLSAPIRVPAISDVYSSAGNVTINYYFERKN